MEPTPTLQTILTDIASRNADTKVNLEFGDQAAIKPDGTIIVPPNASEVLGKVDEHDDESSIDIDSNTITDFRIVRDSAAHEGHHKYLTDLDQMEDFAQRYPEAPKLSTTILNVVEDVFIDTYRLNRYPGQRIEYTFKIKQWFDGRRDEFPNDPEPEDMANGIIEIAKSGGVVGIEHCTNDDILNFFEWARDMFDIVREDAIATYNDEQENEKQLRWEMAATITDRLLQVLGNEENVNKANENVDIPFPQHGVVNMSGFGMSDEPNPDGMDMDTAGGLQVTISPDDIDKLKAGGDDEDGIDIDVVVENTDSEDYMDTESDDGGEQNSDDGDIDDTNGDSGDGTEHIGGDGDKSSGSGGGVPDEPNSSDEDVDGGDNSGDTSQNGDTGEDIDSTGDVGDTTKRSESLQPDFSDWVQVSDSVDVSDVPTRVADEYERAVENPKGNFTPLDESKAERDKRMRSADSYDSIRDDIMEEWGDEIEDAFSVFKTRNREHAVERGPEPHIQNYIDRRAGNKTINKLMKKRLPTEEGNRLNVACVDMSGSINEKMVKTALGAYQYATEIIGDEFAAVAFSAPSKNIQTPLITAPDEPFEWGHIDSVSNGGQTPTEAGIHRANDLVQKYGKRENVVLVITDGKPNMVRNSVTTARDSEITVSNDATAAARDRIQNMRKNAKVIGVGVGHISEQKMEEMFGNDFVVINQNNLASELVNIYKRQMNVDDTTRPR